MAVAKLVCSDCGGVLGRGDNTCPRCGAMIENGDPLRVKARTSSAVSVQRCHVCGHENPATGAYCESCGVRLFSSSQQERSIKNTRQQSGQSLPSRKKVAERRTRRFERWQLLAGAGLVMLVGFFIYAEITKERPRTQQDAHESLSVEAAGAVREIEQLQKAVNGNPNDAASSLRLANLLHDHSKQDPRLLFRALEAYKSYLALNPADPDARVDLGIVYFELARIDSANARQLLVKAMNEMQTVAKAHPGHQAAAFNLGIVSLHAGNTDESNRWFRKTIDINPESDLGTRAQRLLEQHSFQSLVN